MSPLIAYFLGILTILVIFLPFWLAALYNSSAAEAYEQIFCSDLANQDGSNN